MQKLKKNWLVVSNITWGIWWIFTQALKSLRISLQWAILSKVYAVWAKKYREVIFHDTEQWCKNWINPDHEKFGELWLEHRKVLKLYIDGLFLSKIYTASVCKFQRNYVLWHWRVLESLKKNWLLVPKMTWEIWLILIRAVVSLEICTLMYYFCQAIAYKVSA